MPVTTDNELVGGNYVLPVLFCFALVLAEGGYVKTLLLMLYHLLVSLFNK